MARTGRPPKPTAKKILEGNRGKRPLNHSEPKPLALAPICPAWLHDEARAKWKELVPELERLGLVTVVDGNALAALCQAWAEFRWATEAIASEGRTILVGGHVVERQNPDGTPGDPQVIGGHPQPHPAVAQQRSAWKAIKEFSALFGLDPSSRVRLHANPPAAAGEARPKVPPRKR